MPMSHPRRLVRTALLALLLCAAPLTCAQMAGTRPVHGEAPAPKKFKNPQFLESTEGLASLLEDKEAQASGRLLIVDARAREAYGQAHLAGAINVESDPLQASKTPPYYLYPAEDLAKRAAALGIGPETRIVVYDAHAGRLAARVWFTFYAYGHDNVAILDGGIKKWVDEKRPVTQKMVLPKVKGTWTPADTPRAVAKLADVERFREAIRQPGVIPPTLLLDVRSYREYTGEDVRAKHGGHVPGAVNIPWQGMLEPRTSEDKDPKKGYLIWRGPATLYAMLRSACVVPGQSVIVYDQSGGRAAHMLFALKLLGYEKAFNYVGSWREYGNQPDVPVEK